MEHPDVTLPTPRRNPLRRARPWLLFASLLGLTALVATSCLVVGPWLVVAAPLEFWYGWKM